MCGKAITVNAIMVAKPGKEDAAREYLKSLLVPSRANEGCLHYTLNEDCEKPGTFWFSEKWGSKALLDKHLAEPHMLAFFQKKDELLATVEIMAGTEL